MSNINMNLLLKNYPFQISLNIPFAFKVCISNDFVNNYSQKD